MKRMKKTMSLLAALPLSIGLLMGTSHAADGDETPDTNKPLTFSQGMLFPYSILDAALDGNVDKDGHVNYVRLQNEKYLDLFMQAVATADLSKFPVLPKKITTKDKLGREEEKTVEDRNPELVFWINAYNAHVLKAILAAYPVSSPDDIKDFDTAKTRRVAGKDYSLAEIRKRIVTADPRAFFALTDGTQGGPMLRATAYRYSDINISLEDAVQFYVSNPNMVHLVVLEKKVTVNPILQQVDEFFASKAARQKWSGIRSLLVSYTLDGASRRFYTNNPDYTIVFGRPVRVLNRDPSQSPVAAN